MANDVQGMSWYHTSAILTREDMYFGLAIPILVNYYSRVARVGKLKGFRLWYVRGNDAGPSPPPAKPSLEEMTPKSDKPSSRTR